MLHMRTKQQNCIVKRNKQINEVTIIQMHQNRINQRKSQIKKHKEDINTNKNIQVKAILKK